MSLQNLFDVLSTRYMYSQLLGLFEYLLAQPEFYDGGYLHPPHQSPAVLSGDLSFIENDENNFKVNLDVQLFVPNEVSVKVVDGYIVAAAAVAVVIVKLFYSLLLLFYSKSNLFSLKTRTKCAKFFFNSQDETLINNNNFFFTL